MQQNEAGKAKQPATPASPRTSPPTYETSIPSPHLDPDPPGRLTQQKISGRLRSEQATPYAIRGYLSTAAKHGINVLAALRDALGGRPWMPPIPDPP
jgi:hypothetical protein